ncbi:MAG: hypothetical protein U9N77_05955 [Thermodesulfobacteriota bacterium]|nr:hypothetical protein [Thermodesulfobacteriota bacterium]
MVTLHSTWHIILAHAAVALPLCASLLVIIGLIARIRNKEELAVKLTYPIRIFLLLAVIAIVLAFTGAMIDFPSASFAASPVFNAKTSLAIAVFFIYIGLYYLISLKKEAIWKDTQGLSYAVILSIGGGICVSLLGAAGGHLAKGHTIMEPLLHALGIT